MKELIKNNIAKLKNSLALIGMFAAIYSVNLIVEVYDQREMLLYAQTHDVLDEAAMTSISLEIPWEAVVHLGIYTIGLMATLYWFGETNKK